MKTYMILQGEDNNNSDVLGYFHTLGDAKEVLLDSYTSNPDVFILMMQGNYFGEGFHQYILRYNNNTSKFNRHTI